MKVARILWNGKETFALVNGAGKFATREDVQKQTGIKLPLALEDFIFEGHTSKINESKISYLMKSGRQGCFPQ
jgi:hypothetical protein